MQGQATQIIHAYRQAPWRVQRQWIGAFLLLLIGAAMIAALYLDVTARAAVAGRERIVGRARSSQTPKKPARKPACRTACPTR